jgi:nucleoside 2-deoxyribosyltransferase
MADRSRSVYLRPDSSLSGPLMKIVYLAGLISPNYPESLHWRITASVKLASVGFRVIIPRDMHKARGDGVDCVSVTARDIVLRDFHDLESADVILANLELFGETRQSVGTHMELGWSWFLKKPVVAVCSEMNRVMRTHPFVTETVAHYFSDLDKAIEFLIHFYGA